MQHKYGFHVNRTGNDVFAAIERIKPRVIKTLEHDVGFWKRVREIHPDVYLIGRQYVPLNEQEGFADDPEEAGRSFAERVLRLEANKTFYEGHPLFDAWESYNEVLPGSADPDRKRKYDDFQVAFAGPILEAGFQPIAMNFGTGNMLGRDFLDYFPGTLETYRILGFHEYDWPDMWRLHRESIDNGEDGMWLTLRYRRIMEEVRQVYPDRHVVMITECGMTQGVHPDRGGKDWGPWHPSFPIPEQRYWDSLVWYNNELMKDDYVKSAMLFVVGAVSPWESFEHLGGIMDRLAQQELWQGPIPWPAPPDTEPGDGSGEPEKTLNELLLEMAAEKQVIQFNPNAALQKQIFADGFVPNSPEFDVTHGEQRVMAQRAENLQTGEVRVYHVPWGDWGNVAYIIRDEPSRRAGLASVRTRSLSRAAAVAEAQGDLAEELAALRADVQRLMRHLGAA